MLFKLFFTFFNYIFTFLKLYFWILPIQNIYDSSDLRYFFIRLNLLYLLYACSVYIYGTHILTLLIVIFVWIRFTYLINDSYIIQSITTLIYWLELWVNVSFGYMLYVFWHTYWFLSFCFLLYYIFTFFMFYILVRHFLFVQFFDLLITLFKSLLNQIIIMYRFINYYYSSFIIMQILNLFICLFHLFFSYITRFFHFNYYYYCCLILFMDSKAPWLFFFCLISFYTFLYYFIISFFIIFIIILIARIFYVIIRYG